MWLALSARVTLAGGRWLCLAVCALMALAVGGVRVQAQGAEPAVQVVVFPDDGLLPLLDFIDGAQETLDVYIFELENSEIESRLLTAVLRGVRVRVIIEPNPTGRELQAQAAISRLKGLGMQVKVAGKPFSKTHAKTMIADGKRAWVGTFNFIADWRKTRDYAVVTTAPATVAQLAKVFDEDFGGLSEAGRRAGATTLNASTLDAGSNVIASPANGRSGITALINSATKTIDLEYEQLDDTAIMTALAARRRAGVAVTVVMTDGAAGRGAAALIQQKVAGAVVKLNKQLEVHAKLILVDGKRALVGSHNLTKDSLEERREIGVVVEDAVVVGRLQQAYDKDAGRKAKDATKAVAVSVGAAGVGTSGAQGGGQVSGQLGGAAATAVALGTNQGSTNVGGILGDAIAQTDVVTVSPIVGIGEKLLHLVLAGVLTAAIAYRPWRYFMPQMSPPERQTADTQIMIGVAGAIIVTVIGDSLARAFGLVGLGGLIRFRSDIRDTRDAALMFMMIGIGMACGLGLLTTALLVTLVVFVGMTLIDLSERMPPKRISVRVDEPRIAVAQIRAAFPDARVLEAPNTKAMAPGASTVQLELHHAASKADAVEILELLRANGVSGVRNVAIEDEN